MLSEAIRVPRHILDLFEPGWRRTGPPLVEFSPKFERLAWKYATGGTGSRTGSAKHHAPFAYYFGLGGKCNFFVARRISDLFFNSGCAERLQNRAGNDAGHGRLGWFAV